MRIVGVNLVAAAEYKSAVLSAAERPEADRHFAGSGEFYEILSCGKLVVKNEHSVLVVDVVGNFRGCEKRTVNGRIVVALPCVHFGSSVTSAAFVAPGRAVLADNFGKLIALGNRNNNSHRIAQKVLRIRAAGAVEYGNNLLLENNAERNEAAAAVSGPETEHSASALILNVFVGKLAVAVSEESVVTFGYRELERVLARGKGLSEIDFDIRNVTAAVVRVVKLKRAGENAVFARKNFQSYNSVGCRPDLREMNLAEADVGLKMDRARNGGIVADSERVVERIFDMIAGVVPHKVAVIRKCADCRKCENHCYGNRQCNNLFHNVLLIKLQS